MTNSNPRAARIADLLRLVTLVLSFLLVGKILSGVADAGYSTYCDVMQEDLGETDPLCTEDALSKGAMLIAAGSFLLALTYGFGAFVRMKEAGAKGHLAHLLILAVLAAAAHFLQTLKMP